MIKQVGFTGTQVGLTQKQRLLVWAVFSQTQKAGFEIVFRHGDCVGADSEAHDIAVSCNCKIEIYPPLNPSKRAFKEASAIHPMKDYLDRNHDIVDASDFLIACPKETFEVQRSGTWATVRYAQKKHKKICLILPDGIIKVSH